MIKRTLHLLLVAAILFACSPSAKQTEEAPAEETEAAAEQATTSSEVLNPNLASGEELAGLQQISDSVAQAIGGNRPYLVSAEFGAYLIELVGASQFEAVKESLFLPMNLNTAAESDFLMVPGVGEKMAHEFEEYRPYKSIEQFRREIGKYVSDEEVARYEKYVFVPVNLNTGTKEEILAIPGVGEKMHHEFEEYRPYQSMEQFRREIGKYVDDDELARLERYVTLD